MICPLRTQGNCFNRRLWSGARVGTYGQTIFRGGDRVKLQFNPGAANCQWNTTDIFASRPPMAGARTLFDLRVRLRYSNVDFGTAAFAHALTLYQVLGGTLDVCAGVWYSTGNAPVTACAYANSAETVMQGKLAGSGVIWLRLQCTNASSGAYTASWSLDGTNWHAANVSAGAVSGSKNIRLMFHNNVANTTAYGVFDQLRGYVKAA